MNFITASLTAGEPRSISDMNEFATDISASYGQGQNQSMTVLLTSAGNLRAL